MLMGNNETAQGEDDDLCAMATTDDELKKKAPKRKETMKERERDGRARICHRRRTLIRKFEIIRSSE